METTARRFFGGLEALLSALAATDGAGETLAFYPALARAADLCRGVKARGAKLFFIGNGASAAISSHMAADFWKTGGVRALCCNDGAALTCIGNDCGYDQVFARPLAVFADPGDVLFAISSSGQSPNILTAAAAARQAGCGLVTLTGFAPDNPLRALGDLNFHVPVASYGPVEVLHHAICHCILNCLVHEDERHGG